MTGFLIASTIFLLIYVLFIRYVAQHTTEEKDYPTPVEWPRLTILIPARNEEKNILNCLQAIQNQDFDHSHLEVIVIDDFSEDHTLTTAQSFKGTFNLLVIQTTLPGKKQALMAGIRQASSQLIMTTDADCTMHKDWLKSMLGKFVYRDLNMLCGLVRLEGKGLFQELQQAESAAIVGMSAAMLNDAQPCTCNGANLLFRKDVFEHLGGYQTHAHIMSGDDDLLMQQFAKLDMHKTAYLFQKSTTVSTTASPDFKTFMQQRSRWMSKNKAYLYPYNRLVQAIVVLHLPVFYGLFFLLFSPYIVSAAVLMSFKYAIDFYYGYKIRKVIPFKLSLIWLMPFYQLYIFLLLLYNPFRKAEWKGRSIMS